MVQLTRQSVIDKLKTLSELDKKATLEAVSVWATEISSNPEKIINDLESYQEYASKS